MTLSKISSLMVLLFLMANCGRKNEASESVESSSTQNNSDVHRAVSPMNFSATDYISYPKIIFHSATSVDTNPKDAETHHKNSVEALENMKKKAEANPEAIQWFFMAVLFDYGYNTNQKKVLYSGLLECRQYSCSPEDLIKLKDDWVNSNLLKGQVPLEYRIYVLDGFYSWASDFHMEIMKSQHLK